MKMNKKAKYGILLLILIGIIGFIGMHHIAPYAIIKPQKTNLNITPDELDLAYEEFQIKTNDGIQLKGYWIKSQKESAKGIIIFVHGIGGCKEHFLKLSKKLSQEGIESIIFDGRAHGKSGGEYCTYGYKEKHDISKIIDKIQAENPNLKVGLFGSSLGGAIAIQTLEIEKRIEFGIIESSFTELDKIVYDYKKRLLFGIGIKNLSDYSLNRAGEIGDFDPEKVKPIVSVKNIEQPILIVHGDSDERISVEYGKKLFNNVKSKNKELLIIKEGGHLNMAEKGGEEYRNKIIDFIESNLKQNYSKTQQIYTSAVYP